MAKKYLLCLLFVLALVLGACTSRPNATSPSRPPAQELIRETVALVDADEDIYCGGVYVSDSEVLTAAHCILGMDSDDGVGLLQNRPGDRLRAFVVSKLDTQNDFMLLKVLMPGEHGVATLALALAPAVTGDDLYIAGHPAGVGWTFMKGTVSALRPWMQVQAPIYGGNSGGPAFDANGDLVGLCHAKHAKAPNLGRFSTISSIRAFLST